jgi:post-segregation antitoxin (ccd killing protein)
MATETITIEIDAALAARLRAAGIDARKALRDHLAMLEASNTADRQFALEHASAIEACNNQLAENGLWSDELRVW